MAHYAFLDTNNRVTEVIVGVQETELIDGKTPEEFYSTFRNQTCVRTSYNGNIRKQYAGVGYTYDALNDVFIAHNRTAHGYLTKTSIGSHQPQCLSLKAKSTHGLNRTKCG
jgi:hypothetical protein